MCVMVVNNPGLIVLALQGKTQSHGDNNYLGIALAVEVARPRACPPLSVASASLVWWALPLDWTSHNIQLGPGHGWAHYH